MAQVNETREQTQAAQTRVRALDQHESDPLEHNGVLGQRLIHQTEHGEDYRHRSQWSKLDYIAPVSLFELTRDLPALGILAGDCVLIRYASRAPLWTPLQLTSDSIVCTWMGPERGMELLSMRDYTELVPRPFRICRGEHGGLIERPHHLPDLGEMVAAFRKVEVGDVPSNEFPELPPFMKWRDGEGSRRVLQQHCVGEFGMFSRQSDPDEPVAIGLYTLCSFDREPEHTDYVRQSWSGSMMTWAEVKRASRAASKRQIDEVVLGVFERII